MKSLSRVRLFVTPRTVAYQAPPSMGFSRQECWSGLPFPSPGDLPDPGIEPGSPALRADALLSEPLNIKEIFFLLFIYLPFDLLMNSFSHRRTLTCILISNQCTNREAEVEFAQERQSIHNEITATFTKHLLLVFFIHPYHYNYVGSLITL